MDVHKLSLKERLLLVRFGSAQPNEHASCHRTTVTYLGYIAYLSVTKMLLG